MTMAGQTGKSGMSGMAGMAGSGIDPATQSPTLLLNKDVGITVVTGVSDWADQSGNSRDVAQGSGSLQPANNANGPEGDGNNDYLQSAVACSTMVSVSAYTAIAVFIPNGSSTNDGSYFGGNDGLFGEHANARWGVGLRSNGDVQVGHIDSGGIKQVALPCTFGEKQILCWPFDGATISARLNDAAYSTTAAGDVTALTNLLNLFILSSQYGDASISDLALWDSTLDDATIDGVRDYYNDLRSVY